MFYTFNQYNTGGRFIFNKEVTHFVIVEADNAEVANLFAEEIGLYWNGCRSGQDCSCCGDRWHPTDEYDAEEFPSVRSIPVQDLKEGPMFSKDKNEINKWSPKGQPEVLLYRKGILEPEGYLY